MKEQKISRGDIYYADLNPIIGSEQGGVRPVVVIQNNIGNKYSPTVIVVAISSQLNKANMPTHIEITDFEKLPKDSRVLLEQIRTIDCRRLQEYLGCITPQTMEKLDKALAISVGINNIGG